MDKFGVLSVAFRPDTHRYCQASSCPAGRQISPPLLFSGGEILLLRQWLMKPYPGKQCDTEQQISNYPLSLSCRTTENTYGIMTVKFRVFRNPIISNLDLIDLIVQACVDLHNYLLLTNNTRYFTFPLVSSIVMTILVLWWRVPGGMSWWPRVWDFSANMVTEMPPMWPKI